MKVHGLSKKKALLLVAFLVLVVTGAAVVFVQSRFNVFPQLIASTQKQPESMPFPDIDSTSLTEEQGRILSLLEQEYDLQPSGTKYSEGVEEAWCADFVSWIYNEADIPLENPYSGSWRIPGTYTLREYYDSKEKFKAADSGYTPKVGDIMFYDNPSPFGQHTNFVIANEDGVITTVGGNEPGGIRVVKHTTPDTVGFLGYGEL
jgi:hypothetical protein